MYIHLSYRAKRDVISLSYQKKHILHWNVAHVMSYSAGIPQFFIEKIKYTNRP